MNDVLSGQGQALSIPVVPISPNPSPNLSQRERNKKRRGISQPTAEEARAELAQRELARRHLVDYGQYIYPWWTPAQVHELVCAELEEVFRYIETGGQEGIGALILEMPPQHGKTTIVSRLFASWLLGRLPDSNVILTSYNDDLAGDNSYEVRQIVTSERFNAVFGTHSVMEEPVMLSRDSSSRSAWRLAEPHRGGVRAAGVGGGTTGRSADLIVVDDPFKNREEADNPLIRKKVLKWYTSSILSRQRKGTAIVIIHTRWNREDLIGEALRASVTDPKALQYKIVSFPAFPLEAEEYSADVEEQRTAKLAGLYRPAADALGREPGSKTPLWDEEFPQEMLEKIHSTLEASGQIGDWYALYQQQPRPAEGIFFAASDFKLVDREKMPKNLRWCRYLDLALGQKKTSDWNTALGVAVDNDGNVWMRDMIRVHELVEFLTRIETVMVSDLEKGTMWGVEDVAFQALVFKDLTRKPELTNVAIYSIKPVGDKVARARPLQARGKAGKIFVVNGPWVEAFILEALDFPNGQHDDQIDTASGGLEMAAKRFALSGQLFY